MRRTVMQDVEVAGHQMRKGDKLIMHYHTVNHDERIFGEDAMSFDVRRADVRSIEAVADAVEHRPNAKSALLHLDHSSPCCVM